MIPTKTVTKLLSITLLCMFCVCAPLATQGWAKESNRSISLDFKDVELEDLIKTISELTGRNFIYDERVRGKVTIISPEPMTVNEAYRLFQTVLNLRGYTLVKSGNAHKVVLLQDAKQSDLPVSEENIRGANYVTRLIHLKYADAQVLATNVLLPLIPKTSNLTVYAPTNTLILTDSATNIERLMEIIGKLDLPSALDRLEVFKLEQASADELAKIANSMINQQPNPRRQRGAANTANQPGQVIAYPRTNVLLAIASDDEIDMIRELIKTLDVPGGEDRSNINVYYLKNADAESLAKTLNEIMSGTKQPAQANNQQPNVPLVITADKPTNSLLISAGPEDYTRIRQIIDKLDIRRNQVYVEALILELSMDATREIGLSLQGAGEVDGQGVVLGTGNLNTGSVNFSSFSPPTGSTVPSVLAQTIQGLMVGGLFNPITTTGPDGSPITVPALSALIQLSQTSDDINILSAPRLLTSDNEEAEIIVGSNVPIITNRLTDTGSSSGLATSVAVERKDVALTLRFTPQVTENNLVRLNVFEEITDIAGVQVGSVDEVGPTFTKRQLRNTVLAEDGKTVVLGGLIGTNVQKTESRVPLLSRIPLLGYLFRSKGTVAKKTNLLVFITPRVIRNASEMAEITRREQLTGQKFQTPELREAVEPKSLLIELDSATSESPEEPAAND